MPKRLVNGELVDVPDSAPTARDASSNRSSSPSCLAAICPTPPASFREAITYSIPSWGKEVPVIPVVAVLTLLGVLVNKQACVTTGLVLFLLLALGYSPPFSSASNANSGHSSGSSSSGGVSGVRTVRDLPSRGGG